MDSLEIILLAVAIIAALYGYIHYGRQIPSGKLKPRPFTWLTWGVLGTCISIIQISNGAELGAVGALSGAVSGYVLGAMAWYYGERKIYKTDIASLILAAGVLLAWAFVGDAATATMATAVYMIGFMPTAARGWKAPHKEDRVPFVISVLKYTISFILLGTVSIETAVYPVGLALANLIFVVILSVRRR